jgi:hypothetical protein
MATRPVCGKDVGTTVKEWGLNPKVQVKLYECCGKKWRRRKEPPLERFFDQREKLETEAKEKREEKPKKRRKKKESEERQPEEPESREKRPKAKKRRKAK